MVTLWYRSRHFVVMDYAILSLWAVLAFMIITNIYNKGNLGAKTLDTTKVQGFSEVTFLSTYSTFVN